MHTLSEPSVGVHDQPHTVGQSTTPRRRCRRSPTYQSACSACYRLWYDDNPPTSTVARPIQRRHGLVRRRSILARSGSSPCCSADAGSSNGTPRPSVAQRRRDGAVATSGAARKRIGPRRSAGQHQQRRSRTPPRRIAPPEMSLSTDDHVGDLPQWDRNPLVSNRASTGVVNLTSANAVEPARTHCSRSGAKINESGMWSTTAVGG